ncbi:MAG: carboxypeptidase regulatory-like domain-containing protein [Candidatus Cloacimonetes bacterium]|nr:carboxypeptidase regulatory-like domain-containing protein [Candidatus Cloacimonadota bacterium]
MKNNSTILILSLMCLSLNLLAIQTEITITDPVNGEEIIVNTNVQLQIINNDDQKSRTNSRTGLIWETTDPSGICRSTHISDLTYKVFAGWFVNNQRWSYFGDANNVPLWEYNLTSNDYPSQFINSDGTILIGSAGNTIYKFDPETGDVIWSFTEPDSEEIYNVTATEDGETIYYVSGALVSYMNFTSINYETSSENWTFELPEDEYIWGLKISENGEKLVIQQKHWLTACNMEGEILLQTEDLPNSQSLPSISYDGNKFVVGDQRGYVRLYSYDILVNEYLQIWFYQYPYSGYYNWATAVAISSDGSSIVSGSLNFDGGGEYSGTIAFFDVSNGTPIWTNNIGDDEISCIDISEDGSIIAAASWGPLNDNGSDFWLFNSDSDQPIFEYECTGSPKALDLSSDGTRCIVGGKAVHSRLLGHGGKLYYFDNSPEYGAILGVVTDADTGNLLEDALITVGTYTATSNSNGEYFIEQIEMGNYTLTCELIGYELYSEDIIVDSIEIIDIALNSTSDSEDLTILNEKIFLTNYPNPFNPTTTISFSTTENTENTEIIIYNIKDQIIKQLINDLLSTGQHSVIWNGNDENGKPVSSGIYLYHLKIEGKIKATRKCLLLK